MPKLSVVFGVFITFGLIVTLIIYSVLNNSQKEQEIPQVQEIALSGKAGVLVTDDAGATWKDVPGSEELVPLFMTFRNGADIGDRQSQFYLGTQGSGLWVLPEGKNRIERVKDGKNILGGEMDALALAQTSEGDVLYVSFYDKENGGRLFRLREDGLEELYQTPEKRYGIFGVALSEREDRVIITSGDGNVLEAQDVGKIKSWETIARTAQGIVTLIQHPSQKSTMWALARNGLLYVTDVGGRIWKERQKPTVNSKSVGAINGLVYHPKRARLIAASEYGLIESADDGVTWRLFRTPIPPDTIPITAVGSHPQFEEVFWMGARNQLYRTDDGGISWQHIDVPTAKTIIFIHIDPLNTKKIYVGLR